MIRCMLDTNACIGVINDNPPSLRRLLQQFEPAEIAISEIVGLEDDGFGAWRGDLLVASLIGKRLHRLHLEDGHVVVDEPIEIGYRLRDLVVHGSTIYLSTDDARILRIELMEDAPS